MGESNLHAAHDAISAEIHDLEQRLIALKREQRALRDAASGVTIGDIVRLKGRYDGKDGLVHSINHRGWQKFGSKPWLMVSLRKKDGSFSSAKVHAFDSWEPPHDHG